MEVNLAALRPCRAYVVTAVHAQQTAYRRPRAAAKSEDGGIKRRSGSRFGFCLVGPRFFYGCSFFGLAPLAFMLMNVRLWTSTIYGTRPDFSFRQIMPGAGSLELYRDQLFKTLRIAS